MMDIRQGYPLDSTCHYMLWSAVGRFTAHHGVIRCRRNLYGLLQQTIEKLAPDRDVLSLRRAAHNVENVSAEAWRGLRYGLAGARRNSRTTDADALKAIKAAKSRHAQKRDYHDYHFSVRLPHLFAIRRYCLRRFATAADFDKLLLRNRFRPFGRQVIAVFGTQRSLVRIQSPRL